MRRTTTPAPLMPAVAMRPDMLRRVAGPWRLISSGRLPAGLPDSARCGISGRYRPEHAACSAPCRGHAPACGRVASSGHAPGRYRPTCSAMACHVAMPDSGMPPPWPRSAPCSGLPCHGIRLASASRQLRRDIGARGRTWPTLATQLYNIHNGIAGRIGGQGSKVWRQRGGRTARGPTCG
jgi:hypothetical protein